MKSSDQKNWIVIPSRLNSTRLSEKALQLIAGKPLIVHVLEGAMKSIIAEKIIVATDHDSIASVIKQNINDQRVECVMTPSELPSGTDRCLYAVLQFPPEARPRRVFNIQGDEPLIQGSFIDELMMAWSPDSKIEMMTVARPLADLDDLNNLNVVKVLLNAKSEAIYFSRFPIPFSKASPKTIQEISNPFHHIGIYGFEIEFLKKFCSAGVSSIEQGESLEQLRALQLGALIYVHLTHQKLMGVDTAEDVKKVEDEMIRRRKDVG
ncbi:MAG: 3-deoxy-manno-octulosonate cytidylyltransferase [Pseudobdellovibrionaceae bacterium]